MELRARIRLPQVRRAAMMASLGALLVPATAGASTKTHAPTIASVSPRILNVGDAMTVRGKYFHRGVRRNTVVFQAKHGRAVFVKARLATAKRLFVIIPSSLAKQLTVRNGSPVPTRFYLRVMTSRLGKRYTAARLSPVIGPKPVKPTPPPASAANGDCDHDGVINSKDADDDNDLLPDTTELKFGLSPCNPDTDGDGVSDGFEFQSAKDLNNGIYRLPYLPVPYPGKRPYPNPLDKTDANIDFDGDSLTLAEEYQLWKYTIAHGARATLTALSYSDGKQYSLSIPEATYPQKTNFENWLHGNGYWKIEIPVHYDENGHPLQGGTYEILDLDRSGRTDIAPWGNQRYAEASWLDRDRDGYLSDDERDEDADGLSNYDEQHGRMLPSYWLGVYDNEPGFHIAYAGTSMTDSDTDGDGIRDGADDQDFDDVPNIMELSRNEASDRGKDNRKTTNKDNANPFPLSGRVNPFSPCLPDPASRTCPRTVPLSNAWAPFEDDDIGYLVEN